MKTLTLVICALLGFGLVHADILVNSDFHNGKASWKGDLRGASDRAMNDSSSLDNNSQSGGVIVELKGTWVRIYQTFNSHETNFKYTVTLQTSDDFAPQGASAGGMNMNPMRSPGMNRPQPPMPPGTPAPSNPFLSQLLGGNYSGNANPPQGNEALLMVVDLSNGTFESATLHIDPNSKAPQTLTGTIPELQPHDEKTLYLIFPAGKGSVTLLQVSLEPVTAAPSSDTPTFH